MPDRKRDVVGVRLTEEWGQRKARLSMVTDNPVASRQMEVRVTEGCSKPRLAGVQSESVD